jgi:hypothetical protein
LSLQLVRPFAQLGRILRAALLLRTPDLVPQFGQFALHTLPILGRTLGAGPGLILCPTIQLLRLTTKLIGEALGFLRPGPQLLRLLSQRRG